MKRGIIAALIIIVVGGGGLTWFLFNSAQRTTPPESPNGNAATTPPANEPQSGEVVVRMQNTKFTPQDLRITKGTKVTWVNDDSAQHNVVASEEDVPGGLPTQNALFGKGGSYSFTFDTVGIFTYHCTPHPFMTGTITVE